MKKILLIFSILLINFSFATDWNSTAALNRVNTIGQKILKANNINYPIQFKVSNEADINAYANIDKEIYVYKGLLEYTSDDNELAGVISHEMGHIINGHCAKQGVLNTGVATISNVVFQSEAARGISETLVSSKLSRNDEFEADITGADLMKKAGYNPLAMVSLLNKITDSYMDILSSHPSGEKRLLNVYNYVEYNYPNYIKTGYNSDSYKKAITGLTPAINKRKNSAKLTKKFEKEQKKLLTKKEKRQKKMQGTSSIWDGYYTTLQLMAG